MTIKFNGVRVKPSEAIVTGVATYTDPVDDSQVSLLLHCDGTNNSTTFKDNSYLPKTMTAFGNAKISTAAYKFGSSSGAFDINSSYVRTPYTEDFNLSTGDFTLEAWVKLNTTTGTKAILAKDIYGVNLDWVFQIINATQIQLVTWGGAYSLTVTVPVMNTTDWYHVAAVKSGSTSKIYLNGISYGSGNTPVYNQCNQYVLVGAAGGPTPNSFFEGYLDEVRISKTARYTSNFTPPTSAFFSGDGTSALPANPSVGETVYSSTNAYVCTSTSPVTWKRFLQAEVNITP